MTSMDTLLVHILDAVKLQLEGEKALNKSSKDVFGRLLGPEKGGGGLLYAKIFGQVGTLVKPLTSTQVDRITSSVIEVLDSAFQTYNSRLKANEQISKHYPTFHYLEGPPQLMN